MENVTRVDTNSRRMMPNDAAMFLLVSCSWHHAYVIYNCQIDLNKLNDTIRRLRPLNIKNYV
jgi:hypothetical protein